MYRSSPMPTNGWKSAAATATPRSANIAIAAALMSGSESVSTPSMSKMTALISMATSVGPVRSVAGGEGISRRLRDPILEPAVLDRLPLVAVALARRAERPLTEVHHEPEVRSHQTGGVI